MLINNTTRVNKFYKYLCNLTYKIGYSCIFYLLIKFIITIIDVLYGQSAYMFINNFIRFCIITSTNISIVVLSVITLFGDNELKYQCISFIIEYTLIFTVLFLID